MFIQNLILVRRDLYLLLSLIMSKLNLPAKPPLVQSGRPIQVTSNIFPLKRIPNEVSQIFVYDVKIEAVKPKLRTWKENLRAMKYFLVSLIPFAT